MSEQTQCFTIGRKGVTEMERDNNLLCFKRQLLFCLKWSGFDLSRTNFTLKGPKKDRGSKLLSVLKVFICCGLLLLILLKIIAVFISATKPFSLQLSESVVVCCFLLHGFLSGTTLAMWTYNGFLEKFEQKLDVIRSTPKPSRTLFSPYVYVSAIAALYTLTLFFSVFRDLSTNVVSSSANRNSSSPDGVTLAISALSFIPSYLALLIFCIVNKSILLKLESFNNEMREAAANGHFKHSDLLNVFSSRHAEILQLVRFVNRESGWFRIGSTLCFWLASITCFSSLIRFNGEFSGYSTFTLLLCTLSTTALLLLVTVLPMKISKALPPFSNTVLFDHSIWSSSDNSLTQSANAIMLRTKETNKEMIGVSQEWFYGLLFSIPCTAYIMFLFSQNT